MGILIPAAIFTQIAFCIISRRIAVLTGICLSLAVLVNQLIYGPGLAGFKFYVPAGITPAGVMILLVTVVAVFITWKKFRSKIAVFFPVLFLLLMIALNQALPGEDVFFRIIKFAVPGPIVLVCSGLWFLFILYRLIPDLRGDREYRNLLLTDFKRALFGNLNIYLMILGLMGLMLAIVFTLVTLVQQVPVVFRLISLVFILALLFFLLVRKYSNMKKLDDSDTRMKAIGVPLFYRFLYASVFKPVIICLIIILYIYVLYTSKFSPVAATVAFVLINILLTFFSRQIKSRLGLRR